MVTYTVHHLGIQWEKSVEAGLKPVSVKTANKADAETVMLRLLIILNIWEKFPSVVLQKPFKSQTSFSGRMYSCWKQARPGTMGTGGDRSRSRWKFPAGK